jgi:hypothetical protein
MTTITSRQIAFIEKLQADKAYIAQFGFCCCCRRSLLVSEAPTNPACLTSAQPEGATP